MPKAEPLFRRVGVALVSLFDDPRVPDLPATAAHVRRLPSRGATAIGRSTGPFVGGAA
jgi:hypothetical protein